VNPLVRMIDLATKAHRGQMRKYNNEPYIMHPIRVMLEVIKVSDLLLTDQIESVVCAAVGHDLFEDTTVTYNDITTIFQNGIQIANLIQELTNPSKEFPNLNRSLRKNIDLDHLFKVSPLAKTIKMCDRLDNLRGINDAPESFVRKYLNESEALLVVLRDTLPSLAKVLYDELNIQWKILGEGKLKEEEEE